MANLHKDRALCLTYEVTKYPKVFIVAGGPQELNYATSLKISKNEICFVLHEI